MLNATFLKNILQNNHFLTKIFATKVSSEYFFVYLWRVLNETQHFVALSLLELPQQTSPRAIRNNTHGVHAISVDFYMECYGLWKA